MRKTMILLAALAIPVAGCSNMNATEQRMVTGTGIGAAGGAVIGAIAGNAGLGAGIGAAAGLAGGFLYDQVKKDQASAYNKGYEAGHSGQPPAPPQ
ncbi:MAG TPA: glycine zipper family protein [Acetobacteraceae bacterium]|nr:glycine zipper family protein [Acetobacteraceae bacterium]